MKPESHRRTIGLVLGVFALLLLAACAEDGASPATQTATDSQTTTATASATPATQPELSLRDIRQPVIDHQYQVAITICDEIIESSQKKLARTRPKTGAKSRLSMWSAWIKSRCPRPIARRRKFMH